MIGICEDLRKAVLQAAIQGKLTEQLESDGNAETLYAEIQQEKQRLIKEGKIKKEKELEPIDLDEVPFDIPDNWKWVRLGDIINIKAGEGLTSSMMKNGSIPVYGGNGITGYHDKGIVHEETIVIGRVGYYCGSVHVTEKEAWVTDNAFITTYPKNSINKSYLVYLLKQMNLGKDNSATAQPVVSGKKIYPLLSPLPPLAEQHRIVTKVNELMAKIDEMEKTEKSLNDLYNAFPGDIKASLLQAAIQGRLTEQLASDGDAETLYAEIQDEKKKLIKEGKIKKDKELEPIDLDEVPFDIPDNWKWVKLGNISRLVTKGTTPRGGGIAYTGTGVGFLRAENISGLTTLDLIDLKYVSSDIHNTYLKRSILKENDILLTIAGTLGRTALVKKENLPLNANQAISIIRVIDRAYLNLRYLIYAINAPFIQKILLAKTKITAIPNLTLEIISNCIIPLPPLTEQKRIVEKLDQLLPLCDKIKDSIQK